MSLEATEKECAEGRTAPRVSLADIEAAIEHRYYLNGGEAAIAAHVAGENTNRLRGRSLFSQSVF